MVVGLHQFYLVRYLFLHLRIVNLKAFDGVWPLIFGLKGFRENGYLVGLEFTKNESSHRGETIIQLGMFCN